MYALKSVSLANCTTPRVPSPASATLMTVPETSMGAVPVYVSPPLGASIQTFCVPLLLSTWPAVAAVLGLSSLLLMLALMVAMVASHHDLSCERRVGAFALAWVICSELSAASFLFTLLMRSRSIASARLP